MHLLVPIRNFYKTYSRIDNNIFLLIIMRDLAVIYDISFVLW